MPPDLDGLGFGLSHVDVERPERLVHLCQDNEACLLTGTEQDREADLGEAELHQHRRCRLSFLLFFLGCRRLAFGDLYFVLGLLRRPGRRLSARGRRLSVPGRRLSARERRPSSALGLGRLLWYPLPGHRGNELCRRGRLLGRRRLLGL